MKNVLIIALVVLFLASCNSKPEGFTINGTITGDLDNGTSIYLKTTDSLNQLVDIDTTALENGTFIFEGTQGEPKLHYVFVEASRGNVPFVLENGGIEMKFQKDSMNYAKLKGTVQNDLFMNFLEESRKLSERAASMQKDMRMASVNRDTATAAALREEFVEFQDEAKNFNVDFAKQNPNSLISILIMSNLMSSKAISIDEAKEMYEALTPEMKLTEPAKTLKKRLDEVKSTDIGATAPEFSAPTPNGDLLALSDVKNTSKLTLVDFWAAWCRPCRAENPNIVAVYNKYRDKGFNIIGVSLDTRAEDWKGAIENDGLAWNHISNLKRFQDPIARLYNINAIPAAFLLDENGVIVAKDLRGPALEQKVAEFLN
ncbi:MULTISPECIES: TlpA disulfide reductase family protein [Flavobacteriaceae]|uniref:TlpA disulfide reductase family protein n=1 Tax=Flavobacteriaceae TaxID=49546 RepID=UPI0014910E88|nr:MULTISPECIES: TlpA disulfide reductase family protein [Allomuricauda]MDC6364760.1 TlpA disulfide reductase family protein [Muricauda sp. AC10]